MSLTSTRRNVIALTAGGLIHLSSRPLAEAFGRKESKLLIRKAKDRGHTDIGWLDSYHSFSFGNYFDPERMNFRSLMVINDDKVAAGRGFPTHPHKNMEILSYVLKGTLQHRDSMGTGSIIAPNDIQYMSAGRGITHSEFNPSETTSNHFLQIWIRPAAHGHQPRYQQEQLEEGHIAGRLGLVASGTKPKGNHIFLRQDVDLYAAKLNGTDQLEHIVEPGRHVWLQVAKGSLRVNGTTLHEGDAIATSRSTSLHLDQGRHHAEILLFNLA
ncbi:MAG: pirin family protein [Verrucomicrobiota bacterium]